MKHLIKSAISLTFCLLPLALFSNAGTLNSSERSINAALSDYTWGSWKTTSCFKGIDYRVKKADYPRKWFIEFRNRYRADIYMSVNIEDGFGSSRLHISAGDSEMRDFYTDDKNASRISFYIDKLKFNDKSWGGPYADCDR